MELKSVIHFAIQVIYNSSNRTFMELKSYMRKHPGRVERGSNRTFMELKSGINANLMNGSAF